MTQDMLEDCYYPDDEEDMNESSVALGKVVPGEVPDKVLGGDSCKLVTSVKEEVIDTNSPLIIIGRGSEKIPAITCFRGTAGKE